MQAYFAYIKATFQPELQADAKVILGQYYRLQRRSDSKNAGMNLVYLSHFLHLTLCQLVQLFVCWKV